MRDTGSVLKELALLISVTFIAYSNTFGNNFVWDDLPLIEDNYAVHSFRHVGALFTSPFFNVSMNDGSPPYWRPLILLSFALDYALWGNNTFGFHLTNFLIHSLNAVLVLLLWRAVVRNRTIALGASLVFALHPLQTNAATYISGRTDLLSTTFLLLSCLFYLRYIVSRHASGFCAAGMMVSLFLSLLAKETALVAPLLLFLLGRMVRRSIGFRRHGAVFLSLAAPSAYLLCRTLLHVSIGEWLLGLGAVSFAGLCAVAESLILYARLILFPVGLHMERFITIDFPPSTAGLLCAFLAMLIVLVAMRFMARRGALASLVVWSCAALLPASNIIPLYSSIARSQLFLGEQFLYLPMVGLSAAFVLSIEHLRKRSSLARAAALAALAALGTLTYAHNGYWRDNLTFYTQTLARYPGSARISTNLGLYYAAKGSFAESLGLLRKVMEQNPHFSDAHRNLGTVYFVVGDLASARKELNTALELRPDSTVALDLIGLINISEGKIDDAIAYFKKARDISPRYLQVRFNLSSAYEQKAMTREAIQEMKEIIDIDPSSLAARTRLVSLYEAQGDRARAEAERRAILNLYPECAWTPGQSKER
ncbi:MAG: tetratricopeptide repeat protein [Candidatus Aureabacteria bacterium]|nr:tetratricopeptide repeat protein [Candidatus Auribacterota bacterium]